jgi:hypothetical protein
MSKKIKLIWDFYGEVALETAKHHCIHLKDFANVEKLPFHEIDFTKINEMKAIAAIIVNEIDMKTYRDALKPHRGVLA